MLLLMLEMIFKKSISSKNVIKQYYGTKNDHYIRTFTINTTTVRVIVNGALNENMKLL